MMDYEEKITAIKAVLTVHGQVGKYEMCWCGWNNPNYTYQDHLAAMIAVRIK